MSKKKNKKPSDFKTTYTLKNALTKGDIFTKLSFLIMGLGNLARKQIVKGLLYLVIEVSYVVFMITAGAGCVSELITLGGKQWGMVLDETTGIYKQQVGSDSKIILLYGIAVVLLTLLFVVFWRETIKSGYKAECLQKSGKHVNTFIEDLKSLRDENVHKLLLALPFTGIGVFTILPLIYMISMAFTSYNAVDGTVDVFKWVGLKNFADLFDMGSTIGKQFWSVLGWTLIWAVFATFLNYFFGMILALVINGKKTKGKAFWRFMFILSIAVPQFVSLLIMGTMLNSNGAINNLLKQIGVISTSLPFWTNPTWARVTVIVVNLWVGIPHTLLQVTGILQNIPGELYEAAKVDGANKVTIFTKITLPYMLFVTTPYLITTFTGNVNNFNVIYLLTGGSTPTIGNTAGPTDLLVTWLYKLTIDKQMYNVGAVVGIMTFVVLAIVSLVTYRSTGSYKNEEGFM